MIINSKLKYIFLDVPKTGTTSIQKWLIENDKNAQNKISTYINIDCTHIRYVKLELLMGKDLLNYKLIAVVRDPYERVFSAYNFYKKGAKKNLLPNFTKTTIFLEIKIIIAKLLPFWLWCLIYPLKKTSYFIKSKDNSVLVDYLVDYQNLNETLPMVMEEIGLKISSKIPSINVSTNKQKEIKKFTKLETCILKIKYGKDLKLTN